MKIERKNVERRTEKELSAAAWKRDLSFGGMCGLAIASGILLSLSKPSAWFIVVATLALVTVVFLQKMLHKPIHFGKEFLYGLGIGFGLESIVWFVLFYLLR